MRKNDPRHELTSKIQTELIAAACSTELGKHFMHFSTWPDERREKIRRKNFPQFFMGEFDQQEAIDAPAKNLSALMKAMKALVPDYYKAIDRGNPCKLKKILDKGFPLNLLNPVTGGTALHSLAAGGARPAIRLLLTYENIDFLIRDKKGRLPSEMAYLYGHDPALARLLGIKERKQAEAKGIKLTRRPPPEPKP